MTPDMKNIAERIKELRDINGISIETLVKEFHVSIDVACRFL